MVDTKCWESHAFLRKNTPELRESLRNLGKRELCKVPETKKYLMCTPQWYIQCNNDDIPPIVKDCGEDSDLFIQIASENKN